MAGELAKFSGRRNVGDIRQKGLMAGIEIVADRNTRERFPPERKVGQQVIRKAREGGVILRPLGDVIVLMPPLSVTEGEIESLVRISGRAIDAVFGGGHTEEGKGGHSST
jgi:adenosylmethionine-8-amino-7-oxononanoate aminotransferase